MTSLNRVICKSGLSGWQANLHSVYESFEEFAAYCDIYNLHRRLGYLTVVGCWRSNPTVQGSVNPNDYRRVA